MAPILPEQDARQVPNTVARQVPKQYREVAGQPVLAHSLLKLLALPELEQVVVVLHPDDEHFARLAIARNAKVISTTGGKERQDSVLNGLAALSEAQADDWVLVHDAVRPCVTVADLQKLLATLADHPVGGLLGAPVDSTLKAVDDNSVVTGTVDRSRLWQAYTPQMFRVGQLRKAMQQASDSKKAITDEASAIEAYGLQPQLVLGNKHNIKITHESDLQLADWLLQEQLRAGSS